MQTSEPNNGAQIGHRHMGQIGRRRVVATLHHGTGTFVRAAGRFTCLFAEFGLQAGHGAKCAVQRRWHPEGQKDDGYDLIQNAHG